MYAWDGTAEPALNVRPGVEPEPKVAFSLVDAMSTVPVPLTVSTGERVLRSSPMPIVAAKLNESPAA
jgi:hypothetical protein